MEARPGSDVVLQDRSLISVHWELAQLIAKSLGLSEAMAPLSILEDGGRTWVQQASNTNASLMKVVAVDRCNAWIVGDTDNGYAVILRTSDGGRTWTRQGNASTVRAQGLIDVTAADNRNAWAVGTGPTGVGFTVLKTKDGGRSWQTQMVGAL